MTIHVGLDRTSSLLVDLLIGVHRRLVTLARDTREQRKPTVSAKIGVAVGEHG